MHRCITHIFIFILLTLFVSSCGQQNQNTLVIYSTHGKEMLTYFEKAFEAKYPEVNAVWLDMGSQNVLDRVRTETENPQADVWWGGPKELFEQAESQELLDAYKPSWAAEVEPSFKSPKDFWYASFQTPEIIMYNSALVAEADAPKEWDDLLSEKWRQKIVIRDPVQSGTMRTIFAALIAREIKRAGSVDSGYAWLERLHRNTKSYAADPTQMYIKLQRGEELITLWNLTDAVLQARINKMPFGVVIPASGTVAAIEGIAIVKGAPHLDAAKKFYEFVTSAENLKVQAEKFYRLPSRKDVSLSLDWVKPGDLKRLDMNDSLAASQQQIWMTHWQTNIKSK
ncbi:MAG: extracellular solute-binding protein [Rhizobacter sp.]|nr:extracellular solute-binding protein [Chlorobiales bacterium]